jgi:hypothetical protein
MSVFKTTFSRALAVIPTDNANVPYPAVVASGTNTSAVTNQLVNTSGNFINLNVKTGDIVYNTTDGTAATVVSVTSATVVVLNADIFTATSKAYVIYQASPQTGSGNPGCFLYVGGAGNVKVTTIGQDVVTFTAVPVGTVLPVQVIKVHASGSGTTATLINALW